VATGDQRVSGLGPTLTGEELHGGWSFTRDVYDWPTLHPNATVISWEDPRVVLVRGFLNDREVAHLQEAAAPGFARSEVVSDAGTVQGVRTSEGSW
jgi:hypothetical protein